MAGCSKRSSVQDYGVLLMQRDLYTYEHSLHVMGIAEAVHACLPPRRKRAVALPELLDAALLHDVGKLFIPVDILNKDGMLDEVEWEEMRKHPLLGKKFLGDTVYKYLGDTILYHHERMDGNGYYGIRGGDIPAASRIIAVADTFSALRTHRVYRPAKSLDETVDTLREVAGTQLDRDIVDCLLSMGSEALRNLQSDSKYSRERTLVRPRDARRPFHGSGMSSRFRASQANTPLTNSSATARTSEPASIGTSTAGNFRNQVS